MVDLDPPTPATFLGHLTYSFRQFWVHFIVMYFMYIHDTTIYKPPPILVYIRNTAIYKPPHFSVFATPPYVGGVIV